jgi:20S proteasome subunit beta 5
MMNCENQDCQYWLAYLGMQCRLHELRHKRRISVAAASKILANLVYSYKGMGLSMVRGFPRFTL